jgi:cell division protein FtsB
MRQKLIIGVVLGVGVLGALRTGANVWKLHKAGERLEVAKRDLALVEDERKQLEEKLKEVADPNYALREARDKLGLGQEGEVIVVVPQEVGESGKVGVGIKEGGVDQNWQKWWDKWGI